MKEIIKGNEKLLIIQFRPVGDILLTAPVAEYLKTRFPNIKIDYMIQAHFYPVLQYNPFVNKIVRIEKTSKTGIFNFLKYIWYRIKAIKEIRKENYDIVLDYIGLPSSAIISYFSGAEYKVGYKKLAGRRLLYNIKAPYDVKDKYTVLRKYDLLKPLGIRIEEPIINTKLYISERERNFATVFYKTCCLVNKFTVLFSPDSPREYKRWDTRNYRDLGKALIKKYGAKILILHGPGEKDYCRLLQQKIGPEAILLPETGILEAAAIIQSATLAVLNCGGMKHVSVAVGTPSITIFGRTTPEVWHPPALEWADCLKGKYIEGDSSFGIYPENVLEKIDNFILKGLIKIPC